MKVKRLIAGLLAAMLAAAILATPFSAAAEDQTQPQAAESTVEVQEESTSDDPTVHDARELMENAGLGDVSAEQMQGDFDALVPGEQQDLPADQTGDMLDGFALFSLEQPAQSADYMFLSDVAYDPSSTIRHGSFMVNKAPSGNTIRLKVNGVETQFTKGMGAHATSTLIYDIGEYTAQYPRLLCYMGVDYSQNGKGNGVKFTVYGSNDKEKWTELYHTGVQLPGNDAARLEMDVSAWRYLKLYAHDNGADGNDHAVYGDLRLLAADYDLANEGYSRFKTLEEYDALLSQNTVEDNFKNHRHQVLERTFVERVGYQSIQNAVKDQPNVREALDWLLDDTNALQLFIEAGNLYNGSGYRSLVCLGDLYEAAQDDLGDSGDALVYKKMMIATAVALCRDIRTYMVNYGGGSVASDPVVRYNAFKTLYDEGKFVRKEEFKTYNMELVRAVVDAKIDDSEIFWLRDYSESKVADLSKRLNSYTFVRYVNVGYSQERFYSADNMTQWNDKYDFLRFGVSYGDKYRYRLWMMMEAGGICWGISGMGMLLNEVHGIPAINTYQPGHEAYLLYTQDANGNGKWDIWNNISGWAGSYTRWGNTISTEARVLLGWGCMEYNKVNGGNNTSYLLLSQAALNQYDKFLNSMFYQLVAQVYPAGSARHEEALNRSLECLDLNLDSLYGLVKSYRADAATTEDEWVALAKRVIRTYTYYPAPMVDLLGQIMPHITGQVNTVELNTLKTEALKKATVATPADTLQNVACQAVAKSLLGANTVELASFSFDGDKAGCVVLDPSYDTYQLMVRISLDGGKTWEQFIGADGKPQGYTPDHVIQLTPDQLARITADGDITVGLIGTEATYTIDIKAGRDASKAAIYRNDEEDLLIGDTAHMEYSLNGTDWQDYDGSLTSTTRFPGDTTVQVRYKAYGTYLQSAPVKFTFTASTDPDTDRYLPLQYVTLEAFSTQNSTSTDHAAKNFIDGSDRTAWHTKFAYTDPDKFYTVRLDRVRTITRLSYLPGGQNGRIQAGEIYVSMDGKEWTLAQRFEGLANDTSRKFIRLDTPAQARYVKLVATKTYGNSTGEQNMYVSGKMLGFYEDSTRAYAPEAGVTYSTRDLTNGSVTATLVLPQGCTAEVTEHVFTANGTHTFVYTDAEGVQHTVDATVSWIDTTPPTATVTYSTQNPTNQPVIATLGDFSEEGVEILSVGGDSHTFLANDSFDFVIRDKAGNQATVTATVNWIDTEAPTATVTYSTTQPTAGSVVATIGQFSEPGVEVISEGGLTHTFTENGTFTFLLRDSAGNESQVPAEVFWIVESERNLWVEFDVTTPTNGPVTATLHGVQEGDEVTSEGGDSHTFTENGTHLFQVVSPEGQEWTVDATVSWIDTQAPTATVTYSHEGWTSDAVTASLTGLSEAVTFEDGSDGSHTFTENGSYTFRLKDAAGNTAEYTATVSWIDPTKPAPDQMTSVSGDKGDTVTLNIDPERVEVLSVNGQSAQSPVFTVTENGVYTIRMRLRDTGYEFEHTIVVDWLKAEEAPAPTEQPQASPVPTPAPTEQPQATPAPTPVPTEKPQATPAPTEKPVQNFTGAGQTTGQTGGKAPAATQAPVPTAAPAVTPAPTEAPAAGTSAQPESEAADEADVREDASAAQSEAENTASSPAEHSSAPAKAGRIPAPVLAAAAAGAVAVIGGGIVLVKKWFGGADR